MRIDFNVVFPFCNLKSLTSRRFHRLLRIAILKEIQEHTCCSRYFFHGQSTWSLWKTTRNHSHLWLRSGGIRRPEKTSKNGNQNLISNLQPQLICYSPIPPFKKQKKEKKIYDSVFKKLSIVVFVSLHTLNDCLHNNSSSTT